MSGTIDTSPEMFGRVVEALNVAYWDWIPGASHVQVSAALAELMDFDPGNWSVERYDTWMHPDEREGYRAWLVDFLKSGQRRAETTYRYVRRDGRTYWARQHNIAERNESGRVTRLTGTVTDITDEKEHEAQNRTLIARQDASIAVLRAISESPDDTQPVFDLIARCARELCGASAASIAEFDGTLVHLRAADGFDPATADRYRADFPRPPGPDFSHGRTLLGNQRIHTRDYSGAPTRFHPTTGMTTRSSLFVPLRHEGRAIGSLGVARLEAGGFDESEVALIESFAEQASLAIAGATTLRDLRERDSENRTLIARQHASIEVLRAISESPGDTRPVFDLIARRARELCGASRASVTVYDGSSLHMRARDGYDPTTASLGDRDWPRPLGSDTMHGRTVLSGDVVHVRNLDTDADYGATSREIMRRLGSRSLLGVPLLSQGRAVGAISLGRPESGGFDPDQIEVVRSFAAQAVIAIDNARLLGELRESLDQQTATAEVLGVINESRGELSPVFKAIVDKAMAICDCAIGALGLYDGEYFKHAVMRGFPAWYVEQTKDGILATQNASFRMMLGGASHVHIPDLIEGLPGLYPDGQPPEATRLLVRDTLVRSVLGVPLRKAGRVLGYIGVWRREVRPFSDKEIALLENFAAQAVIAMENARLLGELHQRTDDLQESLTYQTATSDVLKVISRSTFDLDPVLETLLTAAARLCDADSGTIATVEGDHTRISTHYTRSGRPVRGNRPGTRLPITRSAIVGRTALEGRIIHVEDVAADPEYHRPGTPPGTKGSGTSLGVPLLRDGVVIGVIRLARDQVNAFTDRQIELIRTFADQAVIAIENTRLLTEQREALERQTATAEVLQVINASPGDLMPVFEVILAKAHAVCGAEMGALFLWDGTHSRAVATLNYPGDVDAMLRQPSAPNSGRLRLLAGERYNHTHDVRTDPELSATFLERSGIRTNLTVPLRKDGAVLGYITANRREVRPYSDNEIALLENFAAQAVIAMENARLINEQREALERQTATAEVLGVINASPGNLTPVFDAILEKALRICQPAFGSLLTFDEAHVYIRATRGQTEALAEFRARHTTGRNSPNVMRLIETKRPVLGPVVN